MLVYECAPYNLTITANREEVNEMPTNQTAQTEQSCLYETIAARMGGLIERGTFGAGSRIPSVRALSRQFEVSVTTVLEAYRLLEDRGMIEARPQSGYYVRL